MPDEIAVPLHTRAGNAWLYLTDDVDWDQSAIERVAESLGRLIDVAVERERVSERAAETEASRRAEVAKTAILHAISHDLRSPLTAITTAGSALAIGGVTEAERAELIEVIETESARLAKLVDDLLDLSRIESGRGGAAGGLVRPARRRRVGRGPCSAATTRSSSSCPATCRSCAPTPPSSSGCSRT